MKPACLFLLMLMSCTGFSQMKQMDKISITATRIARSASIRDILKSDTSACKVTSYHFSARLGNTVKSMEVKADEVSQKMKTIVQELKPGDEFVIDDVKYDCKGEHRKSYIFIIH